jgi:hypothetical protein
MADCVEHQRDPGERLDGPVVKEERQAAALVLLGRDQALEEPDPIPLLAAAFPLPPLALGRRRPRRVALSQ